MPVKIKIEEFRIEEIPKSCTWIIIGAPGAGKCLGRDTPVILADGSIIKVQDIKKGMKLMGDDSRPRTVLGTTRGKSMMYNVTQKRADNYRVNAEHILVLKRNVLPRILYAKDKTSYGEYYRYKVIWTLDNKNKSKSFKINGKITKEAAYKQAEKFMNEMVDGEDYTRENFLEVSIKDYLKMPKTKRIKYKGYKVGVDFDQQDTDLDPYILGYWLGDGTSSKPEITTADKEIVEYMKEYAEKENLQVSKREKYAYSINGRNKETNKRVPNTFLQKLREYNLMNNKHIPEEYKINSREVRLNVLAGLIDSDGYLAPQGYYEIAQKSDTLANDIVFLARSLGFGCSLNKRTKICTNGKNGPVEGMYNIMNIYGAGLEDIPILISRKQYNHKRVERIDPLVTDVTITEDKVDDYYGFQLDGNARFLLGDFTVTHNSSLMENICYYNKHKYPTVKVISGSEDANEKKYSSYVHPLYVSGKYEEEDEKRQILQRRLIKAEQPTDTPLNINILDDISNDPKIFHTKVIRTLYKLGSQHYAQICAILAHYAIDLPPDVRKCPTFIALGREDNEIERKKLYANYGGVTGSYNNFCDLMDQITGDHTFMIIVNRDDAVKKTVGGTGSDSGNKLDGRIFWYQTKILKPWRIGCKEFNDWAEQRYNKDYVEEVDL